MESRTDLMNESETIQQYRETDDSNNKLRDELINHYMPLACKMACKYVNNMFTRDDLIEYAYFELINCIISAKTRLRNNSLEPYIVAWLKYSLVNYVIFDPIITYTSKPGGNAWNYQDRPHRQTLVEPETKQIDAHSILTFKEVFRQSITDDRQRIVVDMYLQGYRFKQIAEHLGTTMIWVQRRWYKFQESFWRYYYE